MKMHQQLSIALLIAIAGVLASIIIINSPPQTSRQKDTIKLPTVQVITVKPEQLRMDVRSQGRVMAQTEIDLVTGVSGNIIKINSAFVSGGFFKKGDLLISIDQAEYDLRIAQAQARVMEAQYQLTREKAEFEQARDEWRYLGQGDPNPLSLRIPQLKEKEAKLVAEQAELKNARLLRQRTDIRAPFNGRVRNREVGLGQYLSSGAKLGRIYSTDLVEVRLPLSTHELALIDFPDLPDRSHSIKRTSVKLIANFLGQQQSWLGHIVRSEGVIDTDTGMVVLVAQISDPSGLDASKHGSSGIKLPAATLPIGLFVEAIIEGRWVDNLMILPASVLYEGSRVAIVDANNRLRMRTVGVVRREQEKVVINTGLDAGERVLVSGLQHPIEGIEVIPTELVP